MSLTNKQQYIFVLLEKYGVTIESGLTHDEIQMIEGLYQIKFPQQWIDLYTKGLPVGRQYYNWRDISPENMEYIKSKLEWPYEGILWDIENNEYWSSSWGKEPKTSEEKNNVLQKLFEDAPKLIPIYSHRFLPVVADKEMPVISAYGTDIIYYGDNLLEYFLVEYDEKDQQAIDFEHIEHVPFWMDLDY